jgi:hypothetical protein
MDIALWAVAAVLTAGLLASGLIKMARPREQLVAAGMGFVEDLSPRTVKVIGILEVLAAVGLVLPAVVGVASVLVPLAALGVVLLMVGATITHLRRHEAQVIGVNLAILALAAFVAWGRLGPHTFAS